MECLESEKGLACLTDSHKYTCILKKVGDSILNLALITNSLNFTVPVYSINFYTL